MLNHLLHVQRQKRIAVVENEFGEVMFSIWLFSVKNVGVEYRIRYQVRSTLGDKPYRRIESFRSVHAWRLKSSEDTVGHHRRSEITVGHHRRSESSMESSRESGASLERDAV